MKIQKSWLGFVIALIATGALADQLTHEVLANFEFAGKYPRELALGPDGQYWGATNDGGQADEGTIFKIHPDTGVMSTVLSFTGTSGPHLGASPNGGFYDDGLGFLWGTTREGGINFGTVFKIEVATGALTTLAVFGQTSGAEGQGPSSGLTFADGFLWGVTWSGPGGFGTVYKVLPATGAVTTVVIFTGASGDFLGRQPEAGLVSDGAGFLWGTTRSGGQVPIEGMSGNGTIFKIETATGALTTVVSFTGADGIAPGSSLNTPLLVDGLGFVWGTTGFGGAAGRGSVFKADMVTGAVTTLVEFSDTAGPSKGAFPTSRLVPDGNGFYWGVCSNGGTPDRGTLYKINAATGLLAEVIEFTGTTGALPGRYPNSLIHGAAGILWGTTDTGGASDLGTIFKVATASSEVTVVRELTNNGSGVRGRRPHAALVPGPDGKLWGSTSEGGVRNSGTLFTLDPATDDLTTVHEFLYDGLDVVDQHKGKLPFAALADDGAGFFWGVTQQGGSSDRGTLFKVHAETGVVTYLATFLNASNGGYPYAPLVKVGGHFWGVTQQGGTNGRGTIFKVEIATGTLTKVVDFTGTSGAFKGQEPYGALLHDGAGVLWGTTRQGGSGSGTVFKFNTGTEEFTTVIEFTNNGVTNQGAEPFAGLVDDGAGFLWGTTSRGGQGGGSSRIGTIFKINKSTEELTTVLRFTGGSGTVNPGRIPRAGLINDGEGYLWGTTYEGGEFNLGTVFRVKINTGVLESMLSFKGNGSGFGAGSYPSYGGLYLHSDGKIYGTTETGGSGGAGTVFRLGVEAVPPEFAFSQAIYSVNQGATEVQLTVERTGGTGPTSVTLTLVDGTAALVPPFAAALAGTDYTALPGGQVVLDFAQGDMTKQVNVTLLPKTGTTVPNKHFTAQLGNPAADSILGLIPAATVRILANDMTKPTLKLITPATKVSAAEPYLITGVAGDARGIARVEIVLNGAAAVNATLGTSIKPTAVPFSLPVTIFQGSLLVGANTLQVTAYDFRGNSTTVTRNFNFAQRHRLTVRRFDYGVYYGRDPEPLQQMGTVLLKATPAGNATRLLPRWDEPDSLYSDIVAGTKVQITAKPNKGYLFARWFGSIPFDAVNSGLTVEFIKGELHDQPQAQFIRNPLQPQAGMGNLFNGVAVPIGDTEVNNNSHAWLSGTLVPNTGVFSGQLHVAGIIHRFAATFTGIGDCYFHVGKTRPRRITVGGWEISLFLDIDEQTIRVRLMEGNTVRSEGLARRALYDGKNGLPPQGLRNQNTKGFYTLAFQPLPTQGMMAEQLPNGFGFATLALDLKGKVVLAGTLADGTLMTSASDLVAGNALPFFCQLQTPGAKAGVKGGSFGGGLVLAPDPVVGDVTGNGLFWFRPAAVTELTGTTPAALATQLYTAGWPGGIGANVFGALYDTKQTLQAMLDLLTVNEPVLRVQDGRLGSPVDVTSFTIVGSKIVKNNPADKTFDIKTTLPKGGFNGVFTPNWLSPSTKLPAFRGILIQRGMSRGGYGFSISNAIGDMNPESSGVFLGRNIN